MSFIEFTVIHRDSQNYKLYAITKRLITVILSPGVMYDGKQQRNGSHRTHTYTHTHTFHFNNVTRTEDLREGNCVNTRLALSRAHNSTFIAENQ